MRQSCLYAQPVLQSTRPWKIRNQQLHFRSEAKASAFLNSYLQDQDLDVNLRACHFVNELSGVTVARADLNSDSQNIAGDLHRCNCDAIMSCSDASSFCATTIMLFQRER